MPVLRAQGLPLWMLGPVMWIDCCVQLNQLLTVALRLNHENTFLSYSRNGIIATIAGNQPLGWLPDSVACVL